MNDNGSKSPKINGIIEIEMSQLSKMKQMNEIKITQNDSKFTKMGKVVQSLPK